MFNGRMPLQKGKYTKKILITKSEPLEEEGLLSGSAEWQRCLWP